MYYSMCKVVITLLPKNTNHLFISRLKTLRIYVDNNSSRKRKRKEEYFDLFVNLSHSCRQWCCCSCNGNTLCWGCYHLYLYKQLAMITMGTVPLPSCACLTVKLVIALFVKNAVIEGLLEGEPLAVQVGIALLYAFLQGSDFVGVHNVTLALEATVTFSRWTSA